MPVDSVNGSNNNNNAAIDALAASGSDRVPKKALGQDDFFKLLSTQLASQDPLKPMEDTAFIAQMASFSSLEGMNKLTDEFATFNAQQDFASAQGLLGKTVTLWDSQTAKDITGVVSAVHNDGDGTLIRVGGQDYDVGSVHQVELTSNSTNSN
jgi:flagellar basal-body rod modification protein FlgD